MTVAYNLEVATSGLTNFTKILWRWHGSVWKSIYKELAAWLFFYAMFSLLYRFALNDYQKHIFEDIVAFCYLHSDFIPLTFILGFFVTLVVQRWWEMFNCFGWIDNCALYVAHYVIGNDEDTRMVRRNIIRYVALAQALVFRDVSPVVRERFPNDEAFIAAGFLTENEKLAMDSVISSYAKYWLPIHWAFNLMHKARRTGHIESDRAVELMQERLREFRSGLTKLRAAQWVPVPLAYTQVVFLAVRIYLLLGILGRQHVDGGRHANIHSPLDIYVPLLSILQFIFYLGQVKVAEALLNPYGADDDDFECNWFIDRNLKIGLEIVDDAIGREPPLERDVFWQDRVFNSIYTDHRTSNSRKRYKSAALTPNLFHKLSRTKSLRLPGSYDNHVEVELERGTKFGGSHHNLSSPPKDESNTVIEGETNANQQIGTNGGFITIKVEKAESVDKLS
uniref:Bestrophin homolog n=1 Tax=Plectus sambesii TaxID=2011161 RepID=A0A914VW92_9BILA